MPWTEKELGDLKELLQTETRDDAGKTLGKSLHSVKRAIKKYKIKYPKKTGSNFRLRRTWPKEFTQEQQEVLVGSLLGDGMITKKYPSFSFKQCKAFREYVEYMSEFFQPYMTGNICDSTGIRRGKIVESSVCYTHTAPRFASLRSKWYPDGTKVVPRDIRLTPLMCAHWHVQDGHNRQNRREVILHTNSFCKEDVEFLVSRLKNDVDIKAHAAIKKAKWNKVQEEHEHYVVYVGNQYGDEGYFQFLDLVQPYVTWDCFQYKVDVSEAKKGDFSKRNKLGLAEVLKIRELASSNTYSQKKIGNICGCSQSVVSEILSGKIHQNITKALAS